MMLAAAALVMWWRIPADRVVEFEDWHTHEHFPERLAVPGFLRGARWKSAAADPEYLVMYETASVDVLRSQPYLDRLNNPTPWSSKMFPYFRGMVRSPCVVRGSAGIGRGGVALTVRLSPRDGEAGRLHDFLIDALPALAARPGVTGAHFLEAQPGARKQQTHEQVLRGADAEADRVVLVEGYDEDALNALAQRELAGEHLVSHGAAAGPVVGRYRLAFVLSAQT